MAGTKWPTAFHWRFLGRRVSIMFGDGAESGTVIDVFPDPRRPHERADLLVRLDSGVIWRGRTAHVRRLEN